MVKINWRDVNPGIAHEVGVDYQLFKGQCYKDEKNPVACSDGIMYTAFAMLQPGKAYHAHEHDDHEEFYFIIKGKGEILVGDETVTIKDGDLIYIGKNKLHSIKNTSEDWIEFFAFAAQC